MKEAKIYKTGITGLLTQVRRIYTGTLVIHIQQADKQKRELVMKHGYDGIDEVEYRLHILKDKMVSTRIEYHIKDSNKNKYFADIQAA